MIPHPTTHCSEGFGRSPSMPLNACDRYSFGAFTLDVDERRLSSNGETVRLPPKAFDLLLALVRRAGHGFAPTFVLLRNSSGRHARAVQAII